jgi:hypothetical protein
MKKITNLTLLATLVLLVGCASTTTVTTNRATGVPTPGISSTDSLANVVIGEKITGKGCSNSAFWGLIKSGDNKFLEIYGSSGSDANDRAKAAATYNALIGAKGLSTDIIVHPIWEVIEDKGFLGFENSVCATVTGYRATINGFKQTDGITKPSPDEIKGAKKNGFFSFLN